MRDDQRARYARHVMLPDFGSAGQQTLLAGAARIVWERDNCEAHVIAASYLAASGVGTLVLPAATPAQRAEVAARGADSVVTVDGGGRDVVVHGRPAWWPGAVGDHAALAHWCGACAAVTWIAETVPP